MEEQVKQIADLLKLLANENRLLIFCALIEKPLVVGEIAERVSGISQSALSQHLSLLKAHGVLGCTKAGQYVTYFIADQRVVEVIRTLRKYYCNDQEGL